ncbi:hypothetical protein OIE69_44355 (plasmid) [Actinacidiphila glaucinigra]|uniref:hypothetical protein n=1 Tax=Actinacidiphila glaucinigra TaxID=235986 RepID=UPI002DDBDCCB|nr:hypothetical protein [Actinacidiphila glaucinigra]WSD65938.1 hypothetical protein OIE69_44355 [Actinacidiphila glaucinigra]
MPATTPPTATPPTSVTTAAPASDARTRAVVRAFGISARHHRPERHYGLSRGVTKWTWTRILGRRITAFEITHDAATNTAVLRVYPNDGAVCSRELTVNGVKARQIGRLVYRDPAAHAQAAAWLRRKACEQITRQLAPLALNGVLPFFAVVEVDDGSGWTGEGKGSTVRWLSDVAADAALAGPVRVISHPYREILATHPATSVDARPAAA